MDLERLLATTDIVDLGCGLAKHPKAVGVGNVPLVRPGILHDLDSYPYPLHTDHMRTVIC